MVKLAKYFVSTKIPGGKWKTSGEGEGGGICLVEGFNLRIDQVSVDAHESRNEPDAHEQCAEERDSPLDLCESVSNPCLH